ncbi:MAG: twin-arginine translocase subunit TatC [Phycisphaerales bacterium]|nr:twin-arginine translocase subunit TatC [Phycisphaerales bacterium]
MPKAGPDNPMPLGNHLDELRRRIILALVGLLPIFILGLLYGSKIMFILVRPLMDALGHEHVSGSMMTTSPLEGFMAYLKIAALLALVVGAPWAVIQLWMFVAPGLYQRERRFAYLLGPLSVLLSSAGVLFMYYVMLPFALFFFVHFNAALITRPPTPIVERAAESILPQIPSFAGDPKGPKIGDMWLNTERMAIRVAVPDPKAVKKGMTPDGKAEIEEPSGTRKFIAWFMGLPPPRPVDPDVPVIYSIPLQTDSFVAQQYKISEYISLVLWFAIAFALTFQTPVVVLLLGWAGLVNVPMLRKYRKYVIFICFAIAAVTTPPDAISMLSLAIPMYLLFEVGVLMLRVLPARRVAGIQSEEGDGGREGADDPTRKPDDQ